MDEEEEGMKESQERREKKKGVWKKKSRDFVGNRQEKEKAL